MVYLLFSQIEIKNCTSYEDMMNAALILLSACLGAVNAEYMMQVNYYEAQQCGEGYMNSLDISTVYDGEYLAYSIPVAGSFSHPMIAVDVTATASMESSTTIFFPIVLNST